MLRTSLTPLRMTVGPALGFSLQEDEAARSAHATTAEVVVRARGDISEIRSDPVYERLLPRRITASGTPAAGYNEYPLPVDLPVAPANVYSLFCFGPPVDPAVDISRNLAVEMVVDFGKDAPLVGGVCFGGHPFLPYYANRLGETSSNFGLPREIRVSRGDSSSQDFLDDVTTVTRQDIASHSGVHVIPTGPIRTNRLRLRLSDFPRILKSVEREKYGTKIIATEMWGFAIPYLYLYEYQERMRYRPRVPCGLIAAHRIPYFNANTYFDLVPEPPAQLDPGALPPALPPSPGAPVQEIFPKYAWGSADTVETVPVLDRFVALSAASIFGQRRSYRLAPGETLTEFFSAGRLANDDQLRLVVSQGEEEPRCLSGLRISFPVLPPIGSATADSTFALEILELDPPEGVSALAAGLQQGTEKYCRRLFQRERVRPQTEPVSCRFSRVTAASTIAIVLRCPKGVSATVPILQDIELVQSAHVDVACRPARHRRVGAVGVRLIGESLGDDYARIGSPGLSVVVEHLVGGKQRAVLLEANSLSDLVQAGAQTVLSNHRYQEVTREVTRDQSSLIPAAEGGINYEESRAYSRSDGWTRSETGEHVPSDWNPGGPLGSLAKPDGRWGFNAVTSGETRSQTTQMLPESKSRALLRIREDVKSFLLACLNQVRAHSGAPQVAALPQGLIDVIDGFVKEGSGQLRGPGSWEPADLMWKELWGTRLLPDQLAEIDALVNVSIPPQIATLNSLLDQSVGTLMTAIDRGVDAANAFTTQQGALRLPFPRNPTPQQMNAINAIGSAVETGLSNARPDLGIGILAGTFGVVTNMSVNGGANVGIGITPGIKPVGLGANATGSMGIGGGVSYGVNLPAVTASFAKGRSGVSSKQAQMTGTSYSQHLGARYDATTVRNDHLESVGDRRSIRTYNYEGQTEKQRTHGAEIQWQGELRDIVMLRLPVGLLLPATAGKMSENTDEAIRVRFGQVPAAGVDIDVRFEVAEEVVRDDD